MNEFLQSRIDYERTPQLPYRQFDFRLDRMRDLLRRLGNPQDRYPIVHVAGTKGKGSTAALIAGTLQAAGYQTGLYTSPHLTRIEERIRVDLLPIAPPEFESLARRIQPHVEALDRTADARGATTFFEITTAMALLHFADIAARFVVLEVGLGGRLDSTNVVTPAVSVITTISFDHQKQLGRTLSEIAREKAGIIKPGVPVVCGVTAAEPLREITAIAARQGSRLYRIGSDFSADYTAQPEGPDNRPTGQLNYHSTINGESLTLSAVSLGLLGRHQAANGAIALAALQVLRSAGHNIADSALRQGPAQLQWPARIERLADRPVVILDAAHNTVSIAALLETLGELYPKRRRRILFATSKDKPYATMLQQLLAGSAELVLTKYQLNPRGVPVETLRATAEKILQQQSARTSTAKKLSGSHSARTTQITCRESPQTAWQYLSSTTGEEELICITGSFFLAAELREIIQQTT